jgi:uncharacterized protein YndB with AHSA1/START domain
MSNIRIMREYPHPPAKVWRALTDPDVIPLWTSSGRGGRPEGFSPVVGTRFRFVAKPRPGWRGIVECEVLEAREPSLLRYSWVGDENGGVSQVTYRLEPDHSRTRFTFEHAGFRGLGGFLVGLRSSPVALGRKPRGLATRLLHRCRRGCDTCAPTRHLLCLRPCLEAPGGWRG